MSQRVSSTGDIARVNKIVVVAVVVVVVVVDDDDDDAVVVVVVVLPAEFGSVLFPSQNINTHEESLDITSAYVLLPCPLLAAHYVVLGVFLF